MKLKFTLLGCGSSMGVPRADGFWGRCDPKQKKNYRTRCSGLISSKNQNIIIDTSPDLRSQLIKNKVKNISKVLFTHMHADQTHGINDLRIFFLKQKKMIDVYADKNTSIYLKKSFSYCFKSKHNYPSILKLHLLKKNHYFKDQKTNININSVHVKHGQINCMSFIVNHSLAYASDVSHIYNKDLIKFKNLKYLVIDCLRFSKHPAHYNYDQVIKLIKILKPFKAILTNLHSDLDYNYLLKISPNNVIPGYDGLTVSI